MSKPLIYLSHPMRGKKGNTTEGNADANYQNKNSAQAVENVLILRKGFPEVNWHCPGEGNIPVQTAYKLGYLSIDQILTMDCTIIEQRCSGTLVHRWEASVGADIEEDCSRRLNYPVLVFEDSPLISDINPKELRKFIDEVIEFHKHKEA